MIRPFLFAALVAAAFPAAAEDLSVAVGQVVTVGSDKLPGTVVIGDPKIADVAVEGRTVMVFGKAVGETDLVVFDADREVMFAHRISVGAASVNSVTVTAPSSTGLTSVRWACSDGRCEKEGRK